MAQAQYCQQENVAEKYALRSGQVANSATAEITTEQRTRAIIRTELARVDMTRSCRLLGLTSRTPVQLNDLMSHPFSAPTFARKRWTCCLSFNFSSQQSRLCNG